MKIRAIVPTLIALPLVFGVAACDGGKKEEAAGDKDKDDKKDGDKDEEKKDGDDKKEKDEGGW